MDDCGAELEPEDPFVVFVMLVYEVVDGCFQESVWCLDVRVCRTCCFQAAYC